jgi:hypothetical protein
VELAFLIRKHYGKLGPEAELAGRGFALKETG